MPLSVASVTKNGTPRFADSAAAPRMSASIEEKSSGPFEFTPPGCTRFQSTVIR